MSERPLRLLHVGAGFRPWRRGGLVAYTEDLMGEQVRAGHEVTYLFSGRLYPFLPGPRLRRWRRSEIDMLEVINSPLFDHGRQPDLEVGEPRTERIVERVMDELRPDVIHVHELAGLPFSVLDVARATGAPVLMTLQDYFPLCPTFKLIDSTGAVCLRRQIGADCVATTAADGRDPALLYEATVRHDMRHIPLLSRLRWDRHQRLISRTSDRVTARVRRRKVGPPAGAASFQRRRDTTVERLNRVDRLIAMSNRVAEIYATLGVDPERLSTVQLTLRHIERLRPRSASGDRPVTFATLGGGESEAKGARVLLDAVRALSQVVAPGSFRVLLMGYVAPEFAAEARDLPAVELTGMYPPDQLGGLLDAVDVGIVPSVWEEAYAYAGVEFLAKGIPVIANAIGGMVDYTRDGETGWLNRSCTAGGLAEIMRGIVEQPEQAAALNANLIRERDSIVKPLERHAHEMDAIYREMIAARI